MRANKWCVYGEYGGYFTNLKEAKKCAKEASIYTGGSSTVWLIENGCWYIEYTNGKLTYDGWRK